MARPRSDDKRDAILAAATQLFAERGHWATPTSAVSRTAGIAEGTLFTYFRTKDDLLDTLYRAMKTELAEHLLAGYPHNGGIRDKLEHLWQRYVQWGVDEPAKCLVMSHLKLSDRISDATRAAGMEPFAEVEAAVKQSIRQGSLRKIPVDLIANMLAAMAEATMAGLAGRKSGHKAYRQQGFEMFWNAIQQQGSA